MTTTNNSNANAADTVALFHYVRVCKVETCDDGYPCQCCGRVVKKVHVMANGLNLGSECAAWLATPAYRYGRKPAKKVAALLATCGIR